MQKDPFSGNFGSKQPKTNKKWGTSWENDDSQNDSQINVENNWYDH